MNTEECQMPPHKGRLLLGYHFVPTRWTYKITLHIALCTHVQQVYRHIMCVYCVRLCAKSVNAN